MLKVQASTDFDYMSADYASLFHASSATAFQHPTWQLAMQHHIARIDNVEPVNLTMRCAETDKLLGLIPLVSRRVMGATVLEFANLGLVDYAMPVLHPDFWKTIPYVIQMTSQLASSLGSYDLLRIKHMPVSNPDILRLFPNSQMARADFSAHITDLHEDYDTWREAAISSKERKSRDKKRRALNRAGRWEMRILTDEAEIGKAFEFLQYFRKDRFKCREEKDYTQDALAFDFYRELAKTGAKSGYAVTYQFTLDDEIVAVQFGLTHAQRFSLVITSANYDKIGKFSPGLLVIEDMILDCINKGFTTFDFTIGDEAYKKKFGTYTIPIYTLWHGHSMLGNMGMIFAKLAKKGTMTNHLSRLLTPEESRALSPIHSVKS